MFVFSASSGKLNRNTSYCMHEKRGGASTFVRIQKVINSCILYFKLFMFKDDL